MAPPPNYRQIAEQKARQYGVPVNVFLRQIQQESGFNPSAHSSAGADGIAQFIPSTARQYHVNTRDPLSSLDGAARLDADLLKQYGSIARALSAYNSGRPDAYKDPRFAGGQTYNYVRAILGGTSPAPNPGSGSAGAGAPSSSPVPAAAGTRPAPPGLSKSALVSALLNASQSGDYSGFFGKVKQSRQPAVAPQPTTMAGDQATRTAASVARHGGRLAELLHEGVGGPTHSTGEHIHFASTDPQVELDGIRLAQQLKLSVRENPYTGDTVDPVHAKNSYHYRTFPGSYDGRKLGEAADVSGDPAALMKFYRLMQQRYGGGRS